MSIYLFIYFFAKLHFECMMSQTWNIFCLLNCFLCDISYQNCMYFWFYIFPHNLCDILCLFMLFLYIGRYVASSGTMFMMNCSSKFALSCFTQMFPLFLFLFFSIFFSRNSITYGVRQDFYNQRQFIYMNKGLSAPCYRTWSTLDQIMAFGCSQNTS